MYADAFSEGGRSRLRFLVLSSDGTSSREKRRANDAMRRRSRCGVQGLKGVEGPEGSALAGRGLFLGGARGLVLGGLQLLLPRFEEGGGAAEQLLGHQQLPPLAGGAGE